MKKSDTTPEALGPSAKIPITVVHHSRFDPRTHTGGVETFGRSLGMVFDEVRFTTPGGPEIPEIVKSKVPVICDNQNVMDWPEGFPVIGFMHGFAEEKARLTGGRIGKALAKGQAAAAKRPDTLWVACANWISAAFEKRHGNRAGHVVYHPVDLERFDGQLDNQGSRLILHDARGEHKGEKLFKRIAKTFKDWTFEPLSCAPNEVPDRMRKAAAFIHLSRYEGNSIVCNEAMAMNLPCLFTRVGLMRDGADQFDVQVIESEHAFNNRDALLSGVGDFLESLSTRTYNPRRWSMEHASPSANVEAWRSVMKDFAGLSGFEV